VDYVIDKSSKHNLSIPTHRWTEAQILTVRYATVSKLTLHTQQHNTTTSHTIFLQLLPPFKLRLKYFLS